MPLFKIINHDLETKILVWKISETLDELLFETRLNENSKIRLQKMKSNLHQRAYLSIRKMLEIAGYSDFDMYYDNSGKPHLKPKNCHTEHVEVSISHSHEFATLIISKKPVGIDIEMLKEKTLKIAQRFMDVLHLENLSNTEIIKKATVIWGIKETVFKIKNEKGISFPDHIFEEQFQLCDNKTTAQLRYNNKIENFNIFFQEIEGYVLVYGFER
ncbi:MAG: 4'-phosphopantetheinyl transferase superfamily protein [Flavobacterium sp.]|nr:4'-phosphopantetheinyl transferase superfamily protein [Flavobacterium sp.]